VYTDRPGSRISKQNMFCVQKEKKKNERNTKAKMKCVWQPSIFAAWISIKDGIRLPLPVGCAPCRAVKVENGITVCCVPANNNNTVARQQQLFLFLGFLATYEHFSCSNFINNNWQHTHTQREREREREKKRAQTIYGRSTNPSPCSRDLETRSGPVYF
jgi:hypothetical protein